MNSIRIIADCNCQRLHFCVSCETVLAFVPMNDAHAVASSRKVKEMKAVHLKSLTYSSLRGVQRYCTETNACAHTVSPAFTHSVHYIDCLTVRHGDHRRSKTRFLRAYWTQDSALFFANNSNATMVRVNALAVYTWAQSVGCECRPVFLKKDGLGILWLNIGPTASNVSARAT